MELQSLPRKWKMLPSDFERVERKKKKKKHGKALVRDLSIFERMKKKSWKYPPFLACESSLFHHFPLFLNFPLPFFLHTYRSQSVIQLFIQETTR
jgi:hypothetical protein